MKSPKAAHATPATRIAEEARLFFGGNPAKSVLVGSTNARHVDKRRFLPGILAAGGMRRSPTLFS